MKQYREDGLNPGEYLFKVRSRNRWEESEWSTPLYVYLEEPDPGGTGWQPPDPWDWDGGNMGGTAPPAPTPTWSGSYFMSNPTGYLVQENSFTTGATTKSRKISRRPYLPSRTADTVTALSLEWNAGSIIYNYHYKNMVNPSSSYVMCSFPYWDITDTVAMRYRYSGAENQPETYNLSDTTPFFPQRTIARFEVSNNNTGPAWTPLGTGWQDYDAYPWRGWNFGIRFRVNGGVRQWGSGNSWTTNYTNFSQIISNTSEYNTTRVFLVYCDTGGYAPNFETGNQSGSITIGNWTPAGYQKYKIQ